MHILLCIMMISTIVRFLCIEEMCICGLFFQDKSGSSSILDDSIAEKYSHLPAPLGDSSVLDDPFTVRMPLPHMVPSLPSSLMPSASKAPAASQTPSKSTSQQTRSDTFTSPGPLFGPLSGERVSVQENKSPPMSKYSDVMSPPRSPFSAPPLPPRIYANIPSDDSREPNVISKPLPPLPGNPTPRLVSAKSRSMPPTTSESSAQPTLNVKRESSPTTVHRTPSFKCYDCDPQELGTDSYNSKCKHHSPRRSCSSRSGRTKVTRKEHKTKAADGPQPFKQRLEATLPTGMHAYFAKLQAGKELQKSTDSKLGGHEPFDWLTGAVADFTFNNSSSSRDGNQGFPANYFNTHTAKGLSRWENKNIAGVTPQKHSHEQYQGSLDASGGARAKTTSPPSRDLYGQVSKRTIFNINFAKYQELS